MKGSVNNSLTKKLHGTLLKVCTSLQTVTVLIGLKSKFIYCSFCSTYYKHHARCCVHASDGKTPFDCSIQQLISHSCVCMYVCIYVTARWVVLCRGPLAVSTCTPGTAPTVLCPVYSLITSVYYTVQYSTVIGVGRPLRSLKSSVSCWKLGSLKRPMHDAH
jgi:hypothetical protein